MPVQEEIIHYSLAWKEGVLPSANGKRDVFYPISEVQALWEQLVARASAERPSAHGSNFIPSRYTFTEDDLSTYSRGLWLDADRLDDAQYVDAQIQRYFNRVLISKEVADRVLFVRGE